MPKNTQIVSPPRAWAEINLRAFQNNFRWASKKFGGALMAVVKANAYGHGIEKIAQSIQDEKELAFFGVANVEEARCLSKVLSIKKPIYLLGANDKYELEEIVANQWCPCISSLQEAQAYNKIAQNYKTNLEVHLAIDTGMGRGGANPEEIPKLIEQLPVLDSITVKGVATHLAASDEDENYTHRQIESFYKLVGQLSPLSAIKWAHHANSAGLLAYPPCGANLARPGLMLYGASPIAEFQAQLQPVMSLKSRVTLVRTLPAGRSISYGRTFITKEKTRVATVGIGYGDGYTRHLSGKGAEVAIEGQRFPVLGRVTMDQIMVDVTANSDVQAGCEVELWGNTIPVSELALKASTIPWELFTGISQRVTRVYI